MENQYNSYLVGLETYAEYKAYDEDKVFEQFEKYAHSVYDEHSLAKVVYTDGIPDCQLMLGDKMVRDYEGVEYNFKIPVHYTLRTEEIMKYHDGEERIYYSFACGLDLTSCGKVWLSISRSRLFDTIEEAVKFAEETEGKECYIFTEEKLRVPL
jgi:hypothetical protein